MAAVFTMSSTYFVLRLCVVYMSYRGQLGAKPRPNPVDSVHAHHGPRPRFVSAPTYLQLVKHASRWHETASYRRQHPSV